MQILWHKGHTTTDEMRIYWSSWFESGFLWDRQTYHNGTLVSSIVKTVAQKLIDSPSIVCFVKCSVFNMSYIKCFMYMRPFYFSTCVKLILLLLPCANYLKREAVSFKFICFWALEMENWKKYQQNWSSWERQEKTGTTDGRNLAFRSIWTLMFVSVALRYLFVIMKSTPWRSITPHSIAFYCILLDMQTLRKWMNNSCPNQQPN